MSGWVSVTCRFPDETTAIATAGQLGTVVASGTRDFGNENFACHVFAQWDRWPGTNGANDAGQLATGFWANIRFNTNTTAGAAAYAQLISSGYVTTPADPSNVWL